MFGSITTGASDDLKRVAEIAHSMVHDYAMGTGITSLQARTDGAAESTRRVRDEEVRDLADEAFRTARSIIDSHRALLDELASTLLTNEVLERADIDQIMAGVPAAAPPRIGGGELGLAAATAQHPRAAAPAARAVPAAPGGYAAPPMLSTIDHIGVAVDDLDAALALYRDALGMPLVHRETVAEQGVDAALLDVGDGHVELLSPLGPDTPVGKFLARRGPGLHHVAYRVADVAATLQALEAAGMRLIDAEPRNGIRGSRVAFVHPASTGGVLTEIVQPAEEH